MSDTESERSSEQGISSKVKLAIGAASLFLFIIGVKRTFQMDPAEKAEKAQEPPPRTKRRSRKP